MSRNPSKDSFAYFMEYGVDLATKCIYLGHGVDDECDVDAALTEAVIKGLRILNTIRPTEPIEILINNQGGDTQHGLAIYDAIKGSSSQVHGIVIGHAYSIAAWILQACDVRKMTRSSSMMIHDGDGVIAGNVEATKNWYKFYQEQDVYCREILLNRIREKNPAYTLRALEKLLKTDTLLWPNQALELGLIDEIID